MGRADEPRSGTETSSSAPPAREQEALGVSARGTVLAIVGVVVLVAASCGDEPDPEVAGVVLEQDEDASASDAGDGPADETTDPEAPGAAGDGAEDDQPQPDPLVLGEVVSDVGISHRFEDDGVEIGSGQVLESDEVTRHLVADVLLDGDRAHCEVGLHAPADRGLVADGHLEVEVVLEGRDGAVTRLEVAALDLDVSLGAGEELRLPATAAVDVDTTGLSALWCEARHR